MAYDIGDRVRVSATFRDPESDAYVDPSTVTVKHRRESGSITTLVYGTDAAVVRDAVGRYHVDLDVDAAGAWHVRFESSGTYRTAQELTFTVRSGSFSP